MAPTRRDFLKTLGGVGAAASLAACSDDGAAPPAGSGGGIGTPPPGFDYPTGAPLPFAHGVASGDPLNDRVILWTRLTHFSPAAAVPVRWEVARDPGMTQRVLSGEQAAVAARDWTVKVDAVGLLPGTTYYYRFSALGAQSAIGRTRTAPATAVSELRFAVLSCSSYWSSYWSGLGNLAARNDLDLVIHCGDYIYDFVDEDEEVRARRDRKDTGDVDYRDWLNLAELRRRYALWRSDPQLLRAHQQHPWFLVWDNHDIDEDYGNELPTPLDGQTSTTTLEQVCQAFHEWTPTRPVKADGSGEFVLVTDGSYPVPPDPRLIWRRLPYGPLADLYGVDTQINLPGHGLEVDASHLTDGESLFGRPQYEWLTTQLLASHQAGTTWRLLNNQTWLAPADVPPLAAGIPLPTLGLTRWTGYTEERAQLFDYLRGNNPAGTRVRGTIVVSGDMHGSFGSDLIENNALLDSGYASGPPLPNPRSGSRPLNAAAGYGRASTGSLPGLNPRAASVGVEFSPSSMGRGGADEIVANARGGGEEAGNIAATRALELALITANRNVQFIEWVDHGYGIVDLNAERAIFEWWWQDKLDARGADLLGFQAVSWAQADEGAVPPRHPDQLDDVRLHGLAVTATQGSRTAAPAPDAGFAAA